MRAEPVRVRRGVSRPVELYSTFYISVCCQELPQPATKDVPATSSPLPSPLTSLEGGEKSESLVAENQRLKMQLKAAQTQVAEAREKMLEKSEGFIASQTDNVRNLYQLTQAMKEKMDSVAPIENCQKELQVCRAQLGEKELKIHKLNQLVRADHRLQEKFETFKEQLRQLTKENQWQKEQLRLQDLELQQQKLKIDKLASRGSPLQVRTLKLILYLPRW